MQEQKTSETRTMGIICILKEDNIVCGLYISIEEKHTLQNLNIYFKLSSLRGNSCLFKATAV